MLSIICKFKAIKKNGMTNPIGGAILKTKINQDNWCFSRNVHWLRAKAAGTPNINEINVEPIDAIKLFFSECKNPDEKMDLKLSKVKLCFNVQIVLNISFSCLKETNNIQIKGPIAKITKQIANNRLKKLNKLNFPFLTKKSPSYISLLFDMKYVTNIVKANTTKAKALA